MVLDIKKEGVIHVRDNVITIQQSPYIEHGSYIEIIHDGITLYEIPYGGGEPINIGQYRTLMEAIEVSNKLV